MKNVNLLGLNSNNFENLHSRLQNWLRRKAAEAPTDVDANPNAAITCPHKALLPKTLTSAKR